MNDKTLSWEEAVLWLREQPGKKDLVRACFYDDPPEKSAERFYQSTEWNAVRRLLSCLSVGCVLDIGAGRGIASYAFARDGWQVTALEPDSSCVVGAGAIRQVLQDSLDITVVEERGEQLPFGDNTFDLVYGRAVLHHADDLGSFCREAHRVLKPGGMFLFTREHVLSKHADLDTFLSSHPLHSLYNGESAYLLAEYLEYFAKSKLKVKQLLTPNGSDINLFPSNTGELIKKIQSRYGFFVPAWVVRKIIIPRRDRQSQSPGRLFSFFGCKE